jgi:hypothetical protein
LPLVELALGLPALFVAADDDLLAERVDVPLPLTPAEGEVPDAAGLSPDPVLEVDVDAEALDFACPPQAASANATTSSPDPVKSFVLISTFPASRSNLVPNADSRTNPSVNPTQPARILRNAVLDVCAVYGK